MPRVQADLRDGQDVQVERGSRHTKRAALSLSLSRLIKLLDGPLL